MLEQWGPGAPSAEPVPIQRAFELCHALAGGHYENFSVLSALVPSGLRDDFAAVYAFCRWADDLADETHRLVSPPAQSSTEAPTSSQALARTRALELLGWWREGLKRCLEGNAEHPVYVALAETIRRRRLRPEPFHDLIDAFEKDQRVAAYANWSDLTEYCRQSAEPVGRLVLMLTGHRPPDEDQTTREIYRQSDLTCTALQLTNFWQDVRTDAFTRGRVYMPTDDTGLTLDDLKQMADRDEPADRVRFITSLRPLAERTRTMFEDARDLPRLVNPAAAPMVWLFAAGGRRVLRKVMARGCTSLWHRPRLSKAEKAGLVGVAWARARTASMSASKLKAARP